MVFKMISGLGSKMFGGDGKDENKAVITRALKVHGLDEYRETTEELERLQVAVDTAQTRMQKREFEEQLNRHRCRQDALRSAAVVLGNRLAGESNAEIFAAFAITDKDRAKVSSGLTDPRQCPAHELARFLIEEAQSDFVTGRAT